MGKDSDLLNFFKSPTFRPTSADQYIGPVCFGHEHVGEGKILGKMLANIS